MYIYIKLIVLKNEYTLKYWCLMSYMKIIIIT